jgi:tetratricopeptide (TPR) repeat protein
MIFVAGLLAGCGPSGPRALVEGDRLVQAGKYSEAVPLLKKATEQLPREARAWNCLGLAYHGAGQSPEAIKSYREALNLSPNLAVARFNLGSLLLELKDYPGAVDEFTTYTLLQKNDVNGWLNRGRAELRARRFEAAEKSYRSSTNLNVRLPEAYNAIGIIQLNRGRQRDTRDAFQSFSNALQIQSNYPPAILNLAIVAHYYLQPKPFDYRPYALKLYHEYLALNPRPGNASQIEAISRQLAVELAPPEPPPLANSRSNQVATPVPPLVTNAAPHAPQNATNPPAPGGAVTIPTTNHPVATAAPAIISPPPAIPEPAPAPTTSRVEPPAPKPVEPVHPTVTEPDRTAALVPMTNQSVAGATAPTTVRTNKPGLLDRLNPINLFRREPKPLPVTVLPGSSNGTIAFARTETISPAVTPSDSTTFPRYHYRAPKVSAAGKRDKAEADLETARTAQKEGRLKDASTALGKAVRADPSFYTAWFNLGFVSNDAGEIEAALSAYESALAIEPDSVGARFNFAQVLQRGGYVLDAADELEKLLAAHPDEPRAHLAMANLYAQKLRQPAKARSHYVEVLRLDLQHPQATAIRYWLRDNP